MFEGLKRAFGKSSPESCMHIGKKPDIKRSRPVREVIKPINIKTEKTANTEDISAIRDKIASFTPDKSLTEQTLKRDITTPMENRTDPAVIKLFQEKKNEGAFMLAGEETPPTSRGKGSKEMLDRGISNLKHEIDYSGAIDIGEENKEEPTNDDWVVRGDSQLNKDNEYRI